MTNTLQNALVCDLDWLEFVDMYIRVNGLPNEPPAEEAICLPCA